MIVGYNNKVGRYRVREAGRGVGEQRSWPPAPARHAKINIQSETKSRSGRKYNMGQNIADTVAQKRELVLNNFLVSLFLAIP